MFKNGDKVQFSKFGSRGRTGFVRGTRPGRVLVQWGPGDRQWVNAEDLVKLPEPVLNPRLSKNRVSMILDFPEGRQIYDYDCGANALLSVLQYYGYKGREDKIMEISDTDEDGTANEGICAALEHFGLEFEAKEDMTVEEVRSHLDNLHPVIIGIQAYPDDPSEDVANSESNGHYVVAIGYEGDKIILEDPSSIQRTYLTAQELVARWHDEDETRWGVVVFGEPAFKTNEIVPQSKAESRVGRIAERVAAKIRRLHELHRLAYRLVRDFQR